MAEWNFAAETQEIAAVHRDWIGTVALNYVTGRLSHRETKAEANFTIEGELLFVDWDRFPPDVFRQTDDGLVLLSQSKEPSNEGNDEKSTRPMDDAYFALPTYVMHYTPLKARKESILAELEEAGISEFKFIETMDRESLTEADTKKFYKADRNRWSEMFAVTRQLFVEANHWRPEKRSWTENIVDDGTFNLPFKVLSLGEISLCCKHFEALRLIAGGTDKFSMILEDDVLLAQNFRGKFESYMTAMPSQWDIIFFGSAFWHRPPERTIGRKVYEMKPARGKCSDSYIVNPRSAKLLCDNMIPFCQPMDWELMYWMNKLKLRCFWWDPPIAIQGSQNGKFESSLRGDATKPTMR